MLPVRCFFLVLLTAGLSISAPSLNAQGKKGEPDPVGEMKVFKGHDKPVRAVDFSPDGKKLYSVGDDKSIRVWDLLNEKKSSVLIDKLKNPCTMLVFATKPTPAKYFYTDGGFVDNKLTKWDATTRRSVYTTASSFIYGAKRIIVSPDGKYVAAGLTHVKAMVWDNLTGALVREFATDQATHAVAFTPDSKRLVASTDKDGSLRMWEVATGKQVWRYKTMDKKPEVMCAAFLADGKKLVTGNQDHVLRVIDTTDKEDPVEIKAHASNIFSIDVNKDGSLLVSGSEDKTLKVWDTTLWKELHEFKHDNQVYCVVFSPDGKRIASCGHDETVRLWGLGKE